MVLFRDRLDAAIRLAQSLRRYRNKPDAVILAVPRGGLPIGEVLSRELGLPLDVILTKKIGHPNNPEFAVGAVSLTGAEVDESVLAREGVPRAYVDAEVARLRALLRERYRMYRGAGEPASHKGKTVILVDDGIATGRTLLAAIAMLKGEGARRVVVAAPVAPPDAIRLLETRADEVVCLEAPEDFMAIGQFYADFSQVSDEEAVGILRRSSEKA